MVELITQWPGHAAEEVERLTTLPLELAMNGTPNLHVMRSISLYGLSDVILTFDEGTDATSRARSFSSASPTHSFPAASRPAWRRSSAPAASFIATSSKAPTARRRN